MQGEIMKGNPQVISDLNAALAMEATLNEQYRIDERGLKFIGIKCLSNKIYQFGNDISDYRRDMLDRVYFLGGIPDYDIVSPEDRGSVTQIFQNELDMENAVVTAMQAWLINAMNARDDNTRNLYEHWIKWHENDHILWLEKQLKLIDAIGEAEYIAEKI